MSTPRRPVAPRRRVALRRVLRTAISSCLAGLVGAAGPASAQETVAARAPVEPTRHWIGLDYTYQNFGGDLAPWHVAAATLGRRGPHGAVLGRVNLARRFGETGTQVEVDAYPRLGDGVYAYLNVGYSGSPVFPEWRSGGELFTTLPRAWEASLGYRQLRFAGAPVTLLTGAVGKYSGNYWISLRPFVRMNRGDASASASVTARRYFAGADDYVGGRIGVGRTPRDDLAPTQADRASSVTAAVQGSRTTRRELVTLWSLGYEREEIVAGRLRHSVIASAGVKYLY